MRRDQTKESKAEHAVQEGRVRQIPARTYEIDGHRASVDNEGFAWCDPKCKAATHSMECYHVLAAKVIDHRENLRRGKGAVMSIRGYNVGSAAQKIIDNEIHEAKLTGYTNGYNDASQGRRRRWFFAVLLGLGIGMIIGAGVCSATSVAQQGQPTGGPEDASRCLGAIIVASQDRVVTPDEARVILVACDIRALEALGQSPVGCDRDRPNEVTCGFPRRSARKFPREFARYNRVRSRLIRCRYQQITDVRLQQCARLIRQFRARWVEGEGVRDPDLPEQVRFNIQFYDWVR